MSWTHYEFKLNEWQWVWKPTGFWLHVTQADEYGPMEAWFGFGFWQFRGELWGKSDLVAKMRGYVAKGWVTLSPAEKAYFDNQP